MIERYLDVLVVSFQYFLLYTGGMAARCLSQEFLHGNYSFSCFGSRLWRDAIYHGAIHFLIQNDWCQSLHIF